MTSVVTIQLMIPFQLKNLYLISRKVTNLRILESSFFRIISNFHDWNPRETDFQHLITRRYSGYWFLPQRLTRSSHSKYSAAKSEIKGAIILIRRKLFPSGGMTAYRGINGQLFAADLLSLSCATTRVSVSYLPRFFHSTWWRTTRTVACSADNRGWPGWMACKHILLLFARTPTRCALLRFLCVGYNTTIRFALIRFENPFSFLSSQMRRNNYIISWRGTNL